MSARSSNRPILKSSRNGNGAACRSGSTTESICTGETYKSVVKLTFAKGAALKDPSGLFNSSLEGHVRRAIDIPEGKEIDKDAFQKLILAAVALNRSKTKSKAKPKS